MAYRRTTRNPIAKAVRTPRFRSKVIPDKRRKLAKRAALREQ